MKIILYTTVLAMWLSTTIAGYAQENVETKSEVSIEILSAKKETVVQEEKDKLRIEVEAINQKLENGQITKEEAEVLKNEAAERRALNIENRLAILDNQIELMERNKSDTLRKSSGTRIVIGIGQEGVDEDQVFGVKIHKRDRKVPYDRRTTKGLTMAFGFNNVLSSGESFNDSDFKSGGSRFFEIGWARKTRVFEDNNWLRFSYGLSFQFNGLKPTENRYFVVDGDQTDLEVFPHHLRKSKFRMDNLVVPLFFEFGPSKKIEKENYFRYSTKNKLRVGLGGYGGINIGSRQKLQYTNDNGKRRRDKIKESYNTSNVIYGLSAYVGWNAMSFYAKYDLNPMFKNNPVDQRNISLGLRFDWN